MRPASAHDRETVMPADPPARTPRPMIEASLRPCRGGPRLEISGELDISAHDYVRDCLNACSALSETIEVDRGRFRGFLRAGLQQAHHLVFARAFVVEAVAVKHRRGLQVHVEVAFVARTRVAHRGERRLDRPFKFENAGARDGRATAARVLSRFVLQYHRVACGVASRTPIYATLRQPRSTGVRP